MSAWSQTSIVAALVTTLAPPRPPLTPDERQTVTADVVRLVGTQIGAMPTFLRLPYRAALLAFDLLPILRWGRPFRLLPCDRQAAWVRRWDERGIGPMRAFVKLIRSCTLLAWFDHPRVTATLAMDVP